MKSEITVPSASAYKSLEGELKNLSASVTCMASCRGCQCRSNTMSIEDLFNDIISPVQSVYDKIVGTVAENMSFTAGGCKCNCTACNSCRCDCRYAPDPSDLDAIWA